MSQDGRLGSVTAKSYPLSGWIEFFGILAKDNHHPVNNYVTKMFGVIILLIEEIKHG